MSGKRWSRTKIVVVTVAAVAAIPFVGIAAFLLYIAAWLHTGLLYSGDGQYRRGAGEAAFQVAFPPIDLSRPGHYRYNFTHLGPQLSYVVGFRITDLDGHPIVTDEYGRPDLPPAERPTAVVTIKLSNEKREQVFLHSRQLSDWDWLRNMSEINGKTIEVPIGGGSVRIEQVSVGPDGGWGTHFTPRWFGHYTLDITVLQPDRLSSRLRAQPVIEAYVAGP